VIRISSKSQVVEWLSGVQIVLLALALVGFGWWIKTRVGAVVRLQIIEANHLVAEQIGHLLMTMGSEEIAYGDANWERFQTIVEETQLPNNGYLCIPDRVLLKPGKLDPAERNEIEKHPQIGERCLDAIEGQLGDDGFLTLAREICAFHHEKWDGSGYPYGMRGEEIPISARLVALADVYDALRSRRPYKEPMSHAATCQIIAEGAGKHFDPAVVESFFQVHREFESISEQYFGRSLDFSYPVQQIPAMVS
jgi:response regulator RpfG family c-di-GMP phosphodiesterase